MSSGLILPPQYAEQEKTSAKPIGIAECDSIQCVKSPLDPEGIGVAMFDGDRMVALVRMDVAEVSQMIKSFIGIRKRMLRDLKLIVKQ